MYLLLDMQLLTPPQYVRMNDRRESIQSTCFTRAKEVTSSVRALAPVVKKVDKF